jgi:hypothetical protein
MLPAKEIFFDKFRLAGKKKKSLLVFAGITVEGILGKKKSKVSELKEIETLGGSIEKIENLVTKLKIAAKFREVNSTFP